MPTMKMIPAGALDIAIEESGPPDAVPVILLHGFPYDPRAYDDVVAGLNKAGIRTIVPYLRGFGPTRFRDDAVMRSGQQAAIGDDLHQLIRALDISPILAGFDWGGRAACVAAALWPEDVRGLVAIGGYLIQDLTDSQKPAPPFIEHHAWHQYYLASERGRRALQERCADFCQYLWRQWSPSWQFDEHIFAASCPSFDNPDFAEIAWHSYAHRIGSAAGSAAYDDIEHQLRARPPISVPTILVKGEDTKLGGASGNDFTDLRGTLSLPGIGHNPPQEAPEAVIEAILALVSLGSA